MCEDRDEEGVTEPCCVCGEPSDGDYDDREDCPWCGSPRCGIIIQGGLDFVDDHGGG